MTASRLAAWTLLLALPGLTPAADVKMPKTLPVTKLPPGKVVPDLCKLRYPVSTTSDACQEFIDQGLGYYYSYVWMEAARAFETATVHDPKCAMAWWELSRALEKWGRRSEATKALLKADELKQNASFREQQLILARMQEQGQAPNAGDGEQRKKKAVATIDTLLSLHDEDEEAWYYRAVLAGGTGFGGSVGAVPFYKALLHVNPLHPGANHELVHYYDNTRRPALGWRYAEKYIESSPGLPHAFHMQAHLATRLGRWDKTSDRSARAVELEKQYHKTFNLKPSQDSQYSHHLEILMISLLHDGRYYEAEALKADVKRANYKHWDLWFRLALGQRKWADAQTVIQHFRKSDKTLASYYAALLYLRQGDTLRAAPEIEVLRGAQSKRRKDRKSELRLWEAQGMYLCLTGDGNAGVKLLERTVTKTKDDYSHHAWGNGAYYMEAWGLGALAAQKSAAAEEAFLEALAHDPGSARAAMGLQVLCEKLNRTEEARRYAALARKFWKKASAQDFDAELTYVRRLSLRGENTSRLDPKHPGTDVSSSK
jgi:Tfp pilus assembly protein PilF